MKGYTFTACGYRVDAPYPTVCVEAENSLYACEMLSNMAGVVSEMSDVTRYFYIAVVTLALYSDISMCFHHISIVEMHHLNLFAELARLLGEDPGLWSCRGRRWWSPSFIAYPCQLNAQISASIKAEEETAAKYSRQARMIRDPNIVAVLDRVIMDEERHLQIFREMCRQL